MSRFRELIPIKNHLPTGQLNAITDVTGVQVGHTTIIRGDGALTVGEGPIRTGVTAILPHTGNIFREKVPAGVYTINGFGKATGFEQIRHLGVIETPICLTNTLNVGKVWDALVTYSIRENPDIAIHTGTVNPVVGECNDNFLSDGQGRHIDASHVLSAIETALATIVEEGCVGAGTGTTCYGFKGGIGTASRVVVDGAYMVGVLMQTNFGRTSELQMLGVPIGQYFADNPPHKPDGSVMIIIATDAPLTSRQLERMAKRAAFGLGRTGTVCHNGSGDFVIAFSTKNRRLHDETDIVSDVQLINEEAPLTNGTVIDALFRGVVECVEECVYNALTTATTTIGRDGNTYYALPHDKLVELMRYYRRLD